jgi:hypothetical protein
MTDFEQQEVWTSVQGGLDTPAGQANDADALSTIIPYLNEEICMGVFVDWCHQRRRDASGSGEILIVDRRIVP